MAEKVPNLRVQFCKSIALAAERNACNLLKLLQSDLQLYDDTEKYEYIHLKRNEVRKDLEGSDEKMYFPVKDVQTNLTNCLENYYDANLIFLTTRKKFLKSQKEGKYVFNRITTILTVYTLQWIHGKAHNLDFSRMKGFKSLPLYLASAKLFLELNRQEAELKNEKTVNSVNELPEKIPPVEQLNEDITLELINQPSPPTKWLSIFKEGGYELFYHLKTEYIKDDQSSKAKYSNIYHFLKYHQLIICTQETYIDFIESEMKVTLSKIIPIKIKYSDIVFPFLSRLKSEFDRKKKLER